MGVKDFIYPKRCLSCGKGGAYLCGACIRRQERVFQICPVCFRKSFVGKTHQVCLNPKSLDGLFSPFYYEGLIRRAILSLKYKFAQDVASELSFWTAYFVKQEGLTFRDFILLPVPTEKKRQNWRGFNQTEVLGRSLADALNLSLTSKLLIKTRYTKPQTELKGEERKRNLKGVFKINSKYKNENLSNYNFLVFDDVWTTGSTVKEAAHVLKRAKAKRVVGLTVAR